MKTVETLTRCSPGLAMGLAPVFPADGPCLEHLPGRARGRRGLTLVEVVIAMLILCVTFSALLASFGMARRSTLMADNSMTMTHQARQALESLRTNRYGTAAFSLGTHTIANGDYVVTRNTSFSNTVDVVLTLRWQDATAPRQSSVTLATSVSKALHR